MSWELQPISIFSDYRESWDALNEANYRSPLLESRFYQPQITHFGDDSLELAIFRDGNSIAAITILRKTNFGSWETFQPSQAPIGAWIADKKLDVATLLTQLANTLPGFAGSIGITQQDPQLYPRPQDQGALGTLDYIRTAKVPAEGTFDDYWSQRGKNLRQNIKRQQNRLEREKVNTRLEIVTEADSVKECIVEYGELETAGWKASKGTAVNIDNEQGKFYCDLLEEYARTQQCYICKFFYDDKLVAMDLCIEAFGTLVILKTSYDESQKTSSPALLMRRNSFVIFFDSPKIKTIEFYGKVMDWHTKWSNDIRVMYHINFMASGLFAMLRSMIKLIKK
ncbi:MAG: GNAT family N-acetyltransferase [Gammaproteobacteria bacterium]|nr:GNAT family N-acetyltransferase [Gammaproteobacteria bacterium]